MAAQIEIIEKGTAIEANKEVGSEEGWALQVNKQLVSQLLQPRAQTWNFRTKKLSKDNFELAQSVFW
jgi:hypothetical protein